MTTLAKSQLTQLQKATRMTPAERTAKLLGFTPSGGFTVVGRERSVASNDKTAAIVGRGAMFG